VPKVPWGDFQDETQACIHCRTPKPSLELIEVKTEGGPSIYFCKDDPITDSCAMIVARQLIELVVPEPYFVVKSA
jgi:hypothetical protein